MALVADVDPPSASQEGVPRCHAAVFKIFDLILKDLKPDNIFVTEEQGRVAFGVAGYPLLHNAIKLSLTHALYKAGAAEGQAGHECDKGNIFYFEGGANELATLLESSVLQTSVRDSFRGALARGLGYRQ